MRTHLTILAAIYIALGSIGVLIALIVFVSVAGGGLISGDPQAIATSDAVAMLTPTVGAEDDQLVASSVSGQYRCRAETGWWSCHNEPSFLFGPQGWCE